jgi:hypothetical protein
VQVVQIGVRFCKLSLHVFGISLRSCTA